MTGRSAPPAVLLAFAALLTVFLLLPTAVLLLRGLTPAFLPALASPAVLDALRVSLSTTLCTLAVTLLFGTPVAYLLARHRFPGRALLDTTLDLPVVLPPVVAGVALLLTFGRQGLLGAPLTLAGISVAFSPLAVVLAQLFTSAPFYIRAAKIGFSAIDRDIEAAALIDGATRRRAFRHVTWPLAFPFLLEGLVLAWARALGEFGATILFAGSLQGRTRTITLSIYAALESDLAPALVLSAVMVIVAFTLLLVVRLVTARRQDTDHA
ncbi:ABC transporter permease [Deinococcus maricopensis]|uniref:Molybdenum transport system permease n=1 Tax=Deinococcus maricopensis (strain DSM 21211 / LMG 22137 / NRRL B-23946 / LB-34) TaxID=709986 RepID=E8U5N7_DEIML|nr:ABC transporter permease [Deinococcus maricopensis]ADV66376.1 NifC-like ABC-type porter [Deinococcus maricopensis DSM 21211]